MRIAVLALGLLALSARTLAQDPAALYQQAAGLERAGKGADAVRLYIRAARGGNGNAAARLAEIYDKGIEGVSRDHGESRKWGDAARTLGGRYPLIGDFPTANERERDQATPQR